MGVGELGCAKSRGISDAFLSNRSIYTSVVCGIVPQARERLWIETADIKDR